MRRQHAAGQRAVLGFHLHQAGQDGAGAQFGGVAAIDAGEERIGEPVHGFGAKVALHQRGDSFVGQAAGARRVQQLQRHANFG